ncbi:restriction endonuclease subunit S [Alistipes onderdonkii]|uniref:restriction endonuclease subunit S n=1 Tax=Alistipes onderdonkii TaxID=328813 RepID=UPI0018772908|nr:restriction endonuclease subunit S [Alistipes onderdonkii]MBE5047785.1 restriction endonuclease subunit S [Alistipes onderdonkii]
MGNNIPQGYKATALGIIPQEWKTIRLKDCFSISAGGDVQKDCFSEAPSLQYKYPIYSNSLFNHGLYGFTSHPRHKANSITITGRGALGHAEYREIDFDAIVRLLVLAPKIPLNGQYITEYINFRKPFFYESTGVPQLTAPQIANIQVLFPPLAEQRKIAEVLGVWDEAIEKQARLIEKLDLRKRGLMQRLLSAKLRLPGFSEPWKKVKLGDIGDTYNGLSGKNKDDFEYGNAQFIPYINVFSNERIDTNNLGCVQIEPNEQQNTVKYGDIFFTVSSETPDEVGMASVLLEHLDNTYLNSFCFGYRLNDFSTLNPFFAAYLFRTEHFRNYMSVLAQGSTRFNISKKEVMKLKIDLPTIEEQTAIAEVLTAADREIELAKEKLDRLRRQKRGLMQQLLTGKKRVKY